MATYGNLPILIDVHNAWEFAALDGLTPLLSLPFWQTSNLPPSSRVFLQHRETTSPGAKMIMCHTCHQDETSSAHFPFWGPSPGHCGQQLQLPLLHPFQVPGWGYKTSGSCSLQNFCSTPEALAMGRCKRRGHHTSDCP